MAAFTMSLTSLYATKLRPAVAQEAEQVSTTRKVAGSIISVHECVWAGEGDKCRKVSRHEKHHKQVHFHLAFCQLRYMMTPHGLTALDVKVMLQILRCGAPSYALHKTTHAEARAQLLVSVWRSFHMPSAHNMWIADVLAHICTLMLGCGQAHWQRIAILRR